MIDKGSFSHRKFIIFKHLVEIFRHSSEFISWSFDSLCRLCEAIKIHRYDKIAKICSKVDNIFTFKTCEIPLGYWFNYNIGSVNCNSAISNELFFFVEISSTHKQAQTLLALSLMDRCRIMSLTVQFFIRFAVTAIVWWKSLSKLKLIHAKEMYANRVKSIARTTHRHINARLVRSSLVLFKVKNEHNLLINWESFNSLANHSFDANRVKMF